VGLSVRRLERKVIKSAGISNTAPGVPSKVRSSTSVAAGLLRSFGDDPALVGVDGRGLLASLKVMTVSRSGAVSDKDLLHSGLLDSMAELVNLAVRVGFRPKREKGARK
jgi:hypothetical protein